MTQNLETLETCMFTVIVIIILKSMDNYKTILECVLNKYPELQLHSKKYVLPLPADG